VGGPRRGIALASAPSMIPFSVGESSIDSQTDASMA